jgi:hypothetical protein
MGDLLRDPIWQFVSVVLALVPILASAILRFWQRPRKELSYRVLSHAPLTSVPDEPETTLQVLPEDAQVRAVDLVFVRLANTGNVPVLPTDYEREVRFAFGDAATVLTAEVVETNPDDIEASVRPIGGTIVLEPLLLNGGDFVTIKALVSQSDALVVPHGRVVGVKHIELELGIGTERLYRSIMLLYLGLLATATAIALSTQMTPTTRVLGIEAQFLIYPLLFIGLGVFLRGVGPIIVHLLRLQSFLERGGETRRED